MSAAAKIPELIRRTRMVPGVIPVGPGSDVRIDPRLFRIIETEARTRAGSMPVVGVRTLADALRALRESRNR